MQNYKYMADLTNNHLLPSATEEHIKICMAHTEFIIVHVWNIDIEHVISLIKKKRNELEGDFRDKVRPHIINLIRLNKLFIDNIKMMIKISFLISLFFDSKNLSQRL